MASSGRRLSNGRSPLIRKQSQITAFFANPKTPNPSPSPSEAKQKKPSLLIPPTSPSITPPTPATAVAAKPKSKTKGSDSEVADAIGKRLRVFWPLDDAWYAGLVKSFDEASGKHLVLYDDGEEELVELEKEKVEWVTEASPPPRKLRRLRRFSAQQEEEKEEKGNSDANSIGMDDSGSDDDWGKGMEEKEEEQAVVESEEEEEEVVIGSRKRLSRSLPVLSKRKKVEAAKSLPVPSKRKKVDVAKLECAKKFSFEECNRRSESKGKEKSSCGAVPINRNGRDQALHSVDTSLTGEAAERFGRREVDKFRFLGECVIYLLVIYLLILIFGLLLALKRNQLLVGISEQQH